MTETPVTKRARTRAKLLQAAADIIGERGFERTSLEAIAARAGMTRGAIYGNFRDKEALFLAVVAERWAPILPPVMPGATFAQTMHSLGEAVAAALPARRAASVAAASFQLYALTHPQMRESVAAANANIYQEISAKIPQGALALPAADFVRVTHALADGLMLLHALTPELIDADVVRAAFTVLARGAAER
jgi:AcrR family transcriptional regulator